MNDRELIRAAFEARRMSYSPYSGFQVGAALLAQNGNVYTGCNIENAGYTPSCCAERTAFFKAVSEGVYDFQKIAIVGGPKDAEQFEICAPCGVCRQVMREFCEPKTFRILLAVSEKEYQEYSLEELFPVSFGPENLRRKT